MDSCYTCLADDQESDELTTVDICEANSLPEFGTLEITPISAPESKDNECDAEDKENICPLETEMTHQGEPNLHHVFQPIWSDGLLEAVGDDDSAHPSENNPEEAAPVGDTISTPIPYIETLSPAQVSEHSNDQKPYISSNNAEAENLGPVTALKRPADLKLKVSCSFCSKRSKMDSHPNFMIENAQIKNPSLTHANIFTISCQCPHNDSNLSDLSTECLISTFCSNCKEGMPASVSSAWTWCEKCHLSLCILCNHENQCCYICLEDEDETVLTEWAIEDAKQEMDVDSDSESNSDDHSLPGEFMCHDSLLQQQTLNSVSLQITPIHQTKSETDLLQRKTHKNVHSAVLAQWTSQSSFSEE